jgi:hypothetical protein
MSHAFFRGVDWDALLNKRYACELGVGRKTLS